MPRSIVAATTCPIPHVAPEEPEASAPAQATAATTGRSDAEGARAATKTLAQAEDRTEAFVDHDPQHHALGRALEKKFDEELARLPPGGKLSVSGEASGGEKLTAGGHGKVEVERARDGGYDFTFEAGGKFGAGVDGGDAKAELVATAGAKITVHCKSRQEAAEALSALTQEGMVLAASAFPGMGAVAWAVEDGDVSPRLHRLFSDVSTVEGELGVQAAAELGLAMGPIHSANSAVEGAASQTVKLDLTTGTLSMERKFELKGSFGLGLKVAVAGRGKDASTLGTTLTSEGAADSVTFRRSVQLSPADLADYKSGKLSLLQVTGRLLQSKMTEEVELHTEGHLGPQAYEGRKIIPSQGPLQDLAALGGLFDSGDGGWTWEAKTQHTLGGRLHVPGVDLGAQATVEVPLLQTQGSFTDFYATLSHRVGQGMRDASFLAYRRALAG